MDSPRAREQRGDKGMKTRPRRVTIRYEALEIQRALELLQANPEGHGQPFLVREEHVFARHAGERLSGLKNCAFTPQAVRAIVKLFSREGISLP
jgi:hypothetical protein